MYELELEFMRAITTVARFCNASFFRPSEYLDQLLKNPEFKFQWQALDLAEQLITGKDPQKDPGGGLFFANNVLTQALLYDIWHYGRILTASEDGFVYSILNTRLNRHSATKLAAFDHLFDDTFFSICPQGLRQPKPIQTYYDEDEDIFYIKGLTSPSRLAIFYLTATSFTHNNVLFGLCDYYNEEFQTRLSSAELNYYTQYSANTQFQQTQFQRIDLIKQYASKTLIKLVCC